MTGIWGHTRRALGYWTTLLLSLLIGLRLASLAAYPLMDTTEGRYGEVARKMAALGDWVTPWFADGVPFWGKPPLAFWLSAGSMRILGVNEFAARLPHFLAAAAVVMVTFDWARRAGVRRPAYVLPLLAGTVLFLVASGAVMTDMALCLGTVLSMRAFWLAVNGPPEHRRREAWLIFAGLWLALMAKGPVGGVLVLLPVVVWTLWTRNVGLVWRAVPWVRGGLCLVALTVPWYALAEARTPGFLEYFFVGEHWKRFVVTGWQGDRYGSAHAFPRGSIWLFAVGACLPWSVILPIAAWRGRRRASPAPQDGRAAERPFILYLLICGLTPCVFFTPAGNILWTYVLPGLPPLALWAAVWLSHRDDRSARRLLFTGVLAAAVLFAGQIVNLTVGGRAEDKSAHAVVHLYRAQGQPEIPLAFVQERMFSAAFYSAGLALQIADPQRIANELPCTAMFVAVPGAELDRLPETASQKLKVVGDAGSYRLFLRPPCVPSVSPAR